MQSSRVLFGIINNMQILNFHIAMLQICRKNIKHPIFSDKFATIFLHEYVSISINEGDMFVLQFK